MAKQFDIQRLSVSGVNYDESHFAVSFHYAGARYHWWSADKIALAHQGPLYKNPPLNEAGEHIKRNEPGHFDTRKLDPDSKQNQALMAHVRKLVIEGGLVEAALIEHRAKQAQEALVSAQNAWGFKVTDAALSLRESLAALIGELQKAHSAHPEMPITDELHAAWARSSELLATLGDFPQ